MAVDNFIPQLWSASILENLNDAHVYPACCNDDYEGEISKFGDSVRINSIGRITINDYTKNSTTLTRQNLQSTGQVLIIDQAKYYDFEIDDIDEAQTKPKLMSSAMEEAGWGLADTEDAFLAALLTANVDAGSILTAATSVGVDPGDDDAYELLVDLGVKLDENNVPSNGRWAVIPPWFRGMLLKDPRFVSFGTEKNRAALINGVVGEAAGFTISISNNVPVSSSAYDVLAGYRGAATFAEQINDPKAYEPEGAFSDAMKGLHLYGAKVTRPYGLAKVVVTAA